MHRSITAIIASALMLGYHQLVIDGQPQTCRYRLRKRNAYSQYQKRRKFSGQTPAHKQSKRKHTSTRRKFRQHRCK